MRSVLGLIFVLTMTILLQGCIVGTAIDAVAETVEAGIEITGAAVGAAVDVVTPDDDDEDEKDD